MRQGFWRIRRCGLAATCLLILLLAVNAGAEFILEDEQPVAVMPAEAWSYPLPLAVLEDPQDVLRLINAENLLEKEYPDQAVEMYSMEPVSVPVTRGEMKVRRVVDDALVRLFAAAEAEGYQLYVGSAHREYRNQEVSHYNRVKKLGYDDGVVQVAGGSEHQAGLAVDVVSWAYRDGFEKSFGKTAEGQWLAAHAAEYGFIIRYQEGKREITGVQYEPWHLRYVGMEAAAYIMASGLTLEEFTAEWQEALARYEGR